MMRSSSKVLTTLAGFALCSGALTTPAKADDPLSLLRSVNEDPSGFIRGGIASIGERLKSSAVQVCGRVCKDAEEVEQAGKFTRSLHSEALGWLDCSIGTFTVSAKGSACEPASSDDLFASLAAKARTAASQLLPRPVREVLSSVREARKNLAFYSEQFRRLSEEATRFYPEDNQASTGEQGRIGTSTIAGFERRAASAQEENAGSGLAEFRAAAGRAVAETSATSAGELSSLGKDTSLREESWSAAQRFRQSSDAILNREIARSVQTLRELAPSASAPGGLPTGGSCVERYEALLKSASARSDSGLCASGKALLQVAGDSRRLAATCSADEQKAILANADDAERKGRQIVRQTCAG